MEFGTKPKQYGSVSVARMTPEQIAEATQDGNLDDLIKRGVDCDRPVQHLPTCSKPELIFDNWGERLSRRHGDPEPVMRCPECHAVAKTKEN